MADSDLIGCWDAIQAVKRDGETDKKAFSRIIRRCMTGELRCVAKTWSHEGESIEYNVEVPAKTWNWNPLTTAGLDIHTGDWTLVSSHLKRVPNSGAGVWATLTGISFDRTGIEQISHRQGHNEASDISPDSQPRKNRGGRKPKPEWVNVACALAEWVEEIGGTPEVYADVGPDVLNGIVLGMASKTIGESADLSRETYAPLFRMFIERMAEKARKS